MNPPATVDQRGVPTPPLADDAEWARIVEMSPIATVIISADEADSVAMASAYACGEIVYANSAGHDLLHTGSRGAEHRTSIFDMIDPAGHEELDGILRGHIHPGSPYPAEAHHELMVGLTVPSAGPSPDGRRSARAEQPATRMVTLHVRPLDAARFVAQVVDCEGWRAVDRVLEEQQRFRSALMELTELAHTNQDDDQFYQRLIERAVEVVPGAQGGSVQLNIPGTAAFRFVSAVGYDLEGLQRHVLEQEHFFRDAWNPVAQIVRKFENEGRTPEIAEWLQTVGRLSEIVVNVSAPVLADGLPVAFLSLDNFEDSEAMTETSIEMTTVLSRLIGDLWQRRDLEAALRKEREALRHQALHDPLTGLANRRSLERSMEEALASSRRQHRPSGVLFVDLDDFKGVNDRLGHEVGDLLLIGVAQALTDVVRTHDVVGRWGGDEFLVLASRLESVTAAEELAERILARFEQDLQLTDDLTFRARLTVGVGWSADSNVDSNTLVRTADEALYEAKAAGKGISRSREALG